MSWIFLAAAAQFLAAIVAIVDKYIVSDDKVLPRPFVYAFYSCLFTGGWVAVYFLSFVPGLNQLPLPSFTNVSAPSLIVVALAFLAAYTFFMALVSMFDALKKADASDVIPVIGAVAAVSSFGLSYYFFDTRLAPNFLWGIGFLALGTFLVSRVQFDKSVALHAIHAGVFFAFHIITMKGLFIATSFDDGFFWSRIGFVFFALSLLLVPSYYEKITAQTKKTTKKAGSIIIFNKVLAGISAFMILKAADLGEVSVVQALDGLKFVFILIIGLFTCRFLPATCGENTGTTSDIVRKALFVAIISLGFIVLFR